MKVVLIGDSIRMGYHPLVTLGLKGRAEVWAPSVNGRYSVWILEHFKSWITDTRPDILHINCGIHDAARVYPDDAPQITLDQYELSLRRIVAKVKTELPNTRMIWALTTPLLKKISGKPRDQWLISRHIEPYNKVARAIMKTAGIPVNDLHRVVMENNPFKCIRDDACHMTPFGNARLARAVMAAIRHAMNLVEENLAKAEAAVKKGDYALAWSLWQWNRFDAGGPANPGNLISDMTGLTDRMRAMLAENTVRSLISSDERAFVEETLATAANAIKAKKYHSAWRALNSPCFLIHYNCLSKSMDSRDIRAEAGPFLVRGWRISKCLHKTGDVSHAPYVRLADKNLKWHAMTSDDPDGGRINVHPLCGERDGIVYLANRINAPKAGRIGVRLGHDGGARLFIDGKSVLCDHQLRSGITPDRSCVTVDLAAGMHEMVVALDLAHGKGWGIKLRFAAADGKPMREREFPFPVLD